MNLLFVDATSTKGMGQRDSWGKIYLGNSIDGNYKSHIGLIGHGKNESDDSWFIMLKVILAILSNIYGINFDIFSDEHQSIRNAISKILPDFERWSACIKHREGNVFKYFGADGANAYKGRYTYIFITYIFITDAHRRRPIFKSR